MDWSAGWGSFRLVEQILNPLLGHVLASAPVTLRQRSKHRTRFSALGFLPEVTKCDCIAPGWEEELKEQVGTF